MKEIVFGKLNFNIVDSYKIMKQRFDNEKEICLFNEFTAKAVVYKSFLGTEIEFEIDNQDISTLTNVDDILTQEYGTPNYIAEGVLRVWKEKDCYIVHGIVEKHYQVDVHIIKVCFKNPYCFMLDYATYDKYLTMFKEISEKWGLTWSNSLVVLGRQMTAWMDTENYSYYISFSQSKFAFYSSEKRKETGGTRLVPSWNTKGKYKMIQDLLLYSFFEGQFTVMAEGMAKPENYAGNVLKIVENIGLILFVTSVGFIAGPKFFGDLKRNFKTYILLGVVIIVSGALACVGCTAIALSTMDVPREDLISIMVGLFAGALTSTPAFSAAKEAVGAELADKVSVGNGIAYIFGVIGVVLFVQLIPKFLKADMAAERAKLAGADKSAGASGDEPIETKQTRKLIEIDGFGIAPFAIAAIIGMLLGSIKFGAFSLTTTGGCLLTALVFGHFSHFGPIKVMPPVQTLKVFREFGLMMFLIGAGVAGGA